MATEAQILSSLSPRACPRCMLTCFSAGDPLRTSTLVENPLQIDLFMQNKPNFRKSQMNVIIYNTKAYENKSDWTLGENKPNSKPIQTQSNPICRMPKMSVNSILTKDYEEKCG